MVHSPLFSIILQDTDQVLQWKCFFEKVVTILKAVRRVDIEIADSAGPGTLVVSGPPKVFSSLRKIADALALNGKVAESEAIQTAVAKCIEKETFGGLGLDQAHDLSDKAQDEILFLVDSWLESLNSRERAQFAPIPLSVKSKETRPMTLTEKIFAHHTRGKVPIEGLRVGDMVRVAVSWILASEASWTVSQASTIPFLLRTEEDADLQI